MSNDVGYLLRQVGEVVRENNATNARGCSFKTQVERKNRIFRFFRRLWGLGFKIAGPKSLGGRHVRAVLNDMAANGYSSSELQSVASDMRTFCRWIGKDGIVGSTANLVSEPDKIRRQYVSEDDKSWTSQGVDPDKIIEQAFEESERIGVQLNLCRHFGLRVKESMLLKPHIADQQHFLAVNWGTKGGRERVVPFASGDQGERQRKVIEHAKSLVTLPNASTIPQGVSLVKWRAKFYYVMQKIGVGREHGFTVHGLRHEYANDEYEKKTGFSTGLRGGNPDAVSRDADYLARQEIAEALGHTRVQIVSMYAGKGPDGRKSGEGKKPALNWMNLGTLKVKLEP